MELIEQGEQVVLDREKTQGETLGDFGIGEPPRPHSSERTSISRLKSGSKLLGVDCSNRGRGSQLLDANDNSWLLAHICPSTKQEIAFRKRIDGLVSAEDSFRNRRERRSKICSAL